MSRQNLEYIEKARKQLIEKGNITAETTKERELLHDALNMLEEEVLADMEHTKMVKQFNTEQTNLFPTREKLIGRQKNEND
jgi:hypothetical protein